MKIWCLASKEAVESLHTAFEGLAGPEAGRRLQEYGANQVEKVAREPVASMFCKELVHFFAIILWLAAGLAFVADNYQPGEGMNTLGWAIVGVIIINALFSFGQAYRAEQAIEALEKLLPQVVKVLRDGAVSQLPAVQIVPGDVILLKNGDSVPADCRVLESTALRVSNAAITGESLPHSRDAAPSDEADMLASRNVLLAGSSVVSGEARALVFATGRHTAFGEIARLTQSTGEGRSPLQMEILRLSRLVAALALGLGFVFFWIGQAIGLSFWANFMFAIGIIVANVPEGLLPTVTLALASGSQRMARRQALIRHLPAVETLGSTTVICTDKTGTLTQNRMQTRKLFLDSRWLDACDDQVLPQAVQTHRLFFEVARCCHDLTESQSEGRSEWLGDPMEVALVELAQRALPAGGVAPRLSEIPFDAQRRRLTTIHQFEHGHPVMLCKGAPEVVVGLCSQVETSHGVEELSAANRSRFLSEVEHIASQGLRVLAFAYRTLEKGEDFTATEKDLVLAGLVALEDPPRPDVAEAVQRCQEAGVKVIMVTGDHPLTAVAVARRVGMVKSEHPVVITGDRLARMSATQLQLALDAPEILFARLAADQKMRVVQTLQRKNEVVAVTGDGVNDAPALKAADIGIAMGQSGTDVAREAADMILLDDHFATIVAAIEEGRAVFENIRKFLTYILTSNIPEIVPYLAFVLARIPLPLTIIQILAVDLGTDMVPALALGAEPPHPTVMKRPPRPRKERLLNWALVARAYLWLGPMQAAAGMAAFFFVMISGGWRYGEMPGPQDVLYRQGTTACLAAIIVMQIVNVFCCRSETESAFRFRLTDNPLILIGIATEMALILVIVYTPWGNAVFGAAPIPASTWIFLLPIALGMLALEELRKSIVRARSKRLGEFDSN